MLKQVYEELKRRHTQNNVIASQHPFTSNKRYEMVAENRGLTTAMSIVNTFIKKEGQNGKKK